MLHGLKVELVHHLFEAQVQRTPGAIAITSEQEKITYCELNQRANQLANYLKTLGVEPEMPVGICMQRSIEMIVGLLGILKAGGAYVPLDPSYPQERLAFMLEDAQVPIFLTQSTLEKQLPEHQAQVVCIDRDWGEIAKQSQETPVSCTNPAHLIYIIYTSGSTGKPKGVAVEHHAVKRLVMDTNYIQIDPSDVIAQVSNCSFDAATFEIWGALVNGAQLVIIDKDIALAPRAFAELLCQKKITTLFLTTALFNLLAREVPSAFHALKHVLFGGEAVDIRWVREVLNHGSPQRLLHVYGPTESTTFTSWYLVQEIAENATTIPIGCPVSNTDCYLLDETLHPVPIGSPGELYIGGIGLARGYVNRPELTAERFIPNPFAKKGTRNCLLSERLYKTGDLARYLPDGNIEYLGRIDHQVKIRGFRIELGEIESVLRHHQSIQDCVVIVREDTPGNKGIVAYVAAAPALSPTGSELRQYLQQRLPEYMVPSAFVVQPQLPLTPNGKVDRKALPVPTATRSDLRVNYVAPRTATEEQVATIWATVLSVEAIGVQDSFLELGGHSLLAAQILARVNEVFQTQLPLQTLFQASTVAELALVIETNRGQATLRSLPPIQPAAQKQCLPLSFSQQQMWVLAQMEPESAYYNDPITLHLHGPLNVAALQQSLNTIIERHAIWRTSFIALDGQPLQIIHPQLTLSLPLIDLQPLQPEHQEQEARRLATAQAKHPFDLTQAPLLRACLVRFSPTQHRLYLTLHHIIYDGISLYTIFLKELQLLYHAFCHQRPSPLPELSLQYADFAVWQRQWLDSQLLTPQMEYWQQQLADLPVLQLPTDRPHPAVRRFRGARAKVELSSQLSGQLKALSRQEGVTLFMTLMAAFKVLLYRYSGQEDLAVATVTSGRNRAEVSELIGCFVNTLVLRTDVSGSPSFQELLQRVKQVTLEAYANQEVPFEQVVQQLQPERKPGHQSLFRVMLEYLNVDSSPVASSLNLELDFQDIHNGTAKFDLLFQLAEVSEGISGWLEYSTELFDNSTIQRLIEHFQTLLEGIIANPAQPIAHLPLLTAAEQDQLTQWNQTFVEYPNDICLHHLIEAQIERTPDAIAVVFENEQLTYRALNQQANHLAAHLQMLGVGPDVLVGVCMERSLEMVVGLLAVLKAGGAYVPLDPGYPQERLAFMLQDTQVPVLLTQSELVKQLPQHSAHIICLDTEWQNPAQISDQPISCEVTPTNLAYVIYTSGSTGKPKGTMNTHQGICNRLLWMQDAYQLTEDDRVLQKTPFSFDVSVWEFFWPLMTGACLVVARPQGHKDSAYLVQLIAEQQITTLHFVPPMLQVFLQEPNLENCRCLKRVICSGEALPFELQEHFFTRLEAGLCNLYGPTEAAIDVTAWTCQRRSDHQIVPIGRPIANMQIHLLDAHLNPVPIGVPGELHIAGIGLARGYLNRPDLTAERFIPNPFVQNKGVETLSRSERLYRTGDLARYLPDGNIEYLGRIDHQVKVRGFRIELGEIEAVIQPYPEVRECVVVVREDIPGDKRLVAYLSTTAPEPFSIAELRQYLRQRLPEFMVPSAFVVLETLPLTANGKVDRKALPTPTFRPELGHTFVVPQTSMEQEVTNLWSSVLNVKEIGIHDNFFCMGGNSLLAAQLIGYIRELFQIELPVRVLFEHPTVEGLAQMLEMLQREGSDGLAIELDLQAEVILDPDIRPTGPYTGSVSNPGHVFLTGATGFLGAFLVHELLQQTQAMIYCLVRAANLSEGAIRIQETLEQYGLWDERQRDRLVPIPGDLAKPLLGLSERQFDYLATQIDVIYHNGALVNFVKPYSLLKAANVLGTQEILRLACQSKTKIVHHVSSDSVFGTIGHFSGAKVLKEEDDINCTEKLLFLGYSQSKWVAEKLVQAAQSRGLPATIVRPGLILGHSKTGLTNLKDYPSRLIKGCIQIGCYPDLPNKSEYFVPIDYASRAIIHLSRQEQSLGQIFHIVNPRPTQFLEFFSWIGSYGYPLKKVPYRQWKERLIEHTRSSQENALYPLVPMIVEKVYKDKTLSELYQGHPYLDCSNTLSAIAGTEITCPAIDQQLRDTYFSYFIRSNFLKAPKGRSIVSIGESK